MLVLALTVASLVLLALGLVPTRRHAGLGAEGAMIAGVMISWFSCSVAALPLVGMSRSATPHLRLTLSTGLRFFLVVALTAPVLLSGWFDKTPLLIWVGVSYFFLLVIDAVFAVTRLGGFGSDTSTTAATTPPTVRATGNIAGNS